MTANYPQPTPITGLHQHGIWNCDSKFWIQVCPEAMMMFVMLTADIKHMLCQFRFADAPVYTRKGKLVANGFHLHRSAVEIQSRIPITEDWCIKLFEAENTSDKGRLAEDCFMELSGLKCRRITDRVLQYRCMDIYLIDLNEYAEVKYDMLGGLEYPGVGYCSFVIQTHERNFDKKI
jgi:hypothetical protein